MRDENQCLHGRDAHAPLAFASHTLSSHFRISEFGVSPMKTKPVAAVCDCRGLFFHRQSQTAATTRPSSKNNFAIHDFVNILGAHRDAATKRQLQKRLQFL